MAEFYMFRNGGSHVEWPKGMITTPFRWKNLSQKMPILELDSYSSRDPRTQEIYEKTTG